MKRTTVCLLPAPRSPLPAPRSPLPAPRTYVYRAKYTYAERMYMGMATSAGRDVFGIPEPERTEPERTEPERTEPERSGCVRSGCVRSGCVRSGCVRAVREGGSNPNPNKTRTNIYLMHHRHSRNQNFLTEARHPNALLASMCY